MAKKQQQLKQLFGSQMQNLMEELMTTFPNDTRMASKLEGKLQVSLLDYWNSTGRPVWDMIENHIG